MKKKLCVYSSSSHLTTKQHSYDDVVKFEDKIKN